MRTNLEVEGLAFWREACHLHSVVPIYHSLHKKVEMNLEHGE